MTTVMMCFGDGLGNATPHDGQYLKSMDFEAHDGRGHLITTPNVEDAKRFDTAAEAFEFWKRSPDCHPIRLSDGKPNRPLTAFNWQFDDPDRAS